MHGSCNYLQYLATYSTTYTLKFLGYLVDAGTSTSRGYQKVEGVRVHVPDRCVSVSDIPRSPNLLPGRICTLECHGTYRITYRAQNNSLYQARQLQV